MNNCLFPPLIARNVRTVAAILFLVSAIVARAQTETAISYQSNWKYLKGTSEASTPIDAWRTNGFDDAGWPTGPAPLSYGEGLTNGTFFDDMRNNYGCIFLRKTFVVTNVANVQSLSFTTYYDDGFVAWINGVAVFMTTNMPTSLPTISTLANPTHDCSGLPPENWPITNSPQSYLVEGTNVLAVQLFQNSLSSSDLRFETTLQITRAAGPDTNPPVVSALSPATNATVTSLTQITVTFSEAVTNVKASDLLVNGSPATGLLGTEPTNSYSFTFAQPASGIVNVAWSGSQAILDMSGNTFQPGGGAAFWTYTLDAASSPVVTGIVPAASATVSNLTQITVTFSRPVIGVSALDLLINGLPASDITGLAPTNRYTFNFTQPAAGQVIASWSSLQGITDTNGLAFEPGVGTTAWSYNLVDNLPPHVSQLTPPASAKVSHLSQIEVLFDEPVQGLDAADLLINGVAATNVTGSSLGPYTFQFVQPADGLVYFSWASGHGTTDTAEIPNAFGGGSWTNTLDTAYGLPTVRINEFLASNVNTNGLKDEFGNLNDWIELYNYGSNAVDLTGCALTDNASSPGKWVFPAVTLGANQYLVVFASGLDRKIVGGTNKLHTSFSLTTGGEYLGLYNAESPRRVIDDFTNGYPEQRSDYSYGRDTTNQLVYFAMPTPGTVNGDSPITGVVEPVHFTVKRGFFSQPFNLLLTTLTPGATIRYTTDGTPPTAASGTIYSSGILITNTTLLRAAAFRSNMLPTLVATHTYIYLSSVLNQPANPPGFPTTGKWQDLTPSAPDYGMDPRIVTNSAYSGTIRGDLLSIPTLSIVMNADDMFGTNAGVYPNYTSTTIEQPCSIEMIYSDGSKSFQMDAGIEAHGGGSRTKTLKHPLSLKFRGKYGYGKMQYQFFPDSPAGSFDSLVLRADYNNHWTHSDPSQRARGGLVRDALIKDVMGAMGDFTSHSRYVHLYINGLYWGVYNPCEDVDNNLPAPYFGGTGDDYDCVRQGDSPTYYGDPSHVAYNKMLSFNNAGLSNATTYAQIQQYLDVQQYADYLILQHYAGDLDWGATKNWAAIRKRETGSQFKYIPWDNERTLEGSGDNVTGNSPNGLQANLIRNSEYKILFADRVHKHLFNNGALVPGVISNLWMARSSQIYRAMVGESARWGDAMTGTPYTRDDHFVAEQNRLLSTYFPVRTTNLLNQYRAIGYYPNIDAPEFNQSGGRVPSGFNLVITAPTGTIYYTTNGVDPRVPITGAVLSSAFTYTGTPITLTGSRLVKARVLSGSTWSALTEAQFTVGSLGVPLRITEIMYNPIGGNQYEFIEVQNIGTTALDVGGYSFEGITFVFPPGTFIAAGETLLIASAASPSQFAARYPGAAVFGGFTGSLDNGGERIAILDANGNTVTAVNYDDEDGWPTAADGGGSSLEVIDPNGNPDAPANWRASSALNGTPGLPPASPALGAVVLNEIGAENLGSVTNGGLFPDWIELQNRGASSTNLLNWSITDSSNARKYVLPSTNLPAGGFLVIWCDSATNAPGLHSGFSLSKSGETISLFDNETNRADVMTFGLQLADKTLGRAPDGWTLTVPTPAAPNIAVALGSVTNLVVNEWLASPAPGGEDWIELFNSSFSAPVALRGVYASTSNALYQIRDYSYLAPRAYVQMLADELPGAGHLDFKLPAAGGAIALADYTGAEFQRVIYPAQVESVTEGRLPDGATNITRFPGSASPGSTNYVLTWSGPVLNEVMARNDRAELSPWNQYVDWVEIYNPSNTTVSLAGMALGDSAKTSDRWIFPTGVTIPALGYLRVWCDGSRAPSTNSSSALNTGFALAGDSGDVYLFNVLGQPVDAVGYGFQLQDVSIGRSGGQWQLLASPTPGAVNAAPAPLASSSALRCNEWMTTPAAGDDWFELYNAGSLPVALDGLYLTDNPSDIGVTQFKIAPLSFIGAGKWITWDADGHPSNGRNHVNFSLDGSGETLRIYDAGTNLISAVDFGLQAPDVSQGRLPDGATNIVSFPNSPSPGDANYVPSGVVINEILSHTDPPLEDAIEFFNPTATNINIGGWFISDSSSDLKRYRIPNETVIAPGGFKVFYQYQFGPADGETDTPPLFTLNSAHGDAAYLSAADSNTNLTGERAQVKFDAAANGVSFGRYQTSVGMDFVALSARTFGIENPTDVAQFRGGAGQTNASPLVGPVVFNEIMYYPPDYGTNTPDMEEFIELYNVSSTNVPLFDPGYPQNVWHLANAVSFDFPTNLTIPPNGTLVVVPFNPATDPIALANFRSRYGTNGTLVGPFAGHLENAGETLELWRPDNPQLPPHTDAGFVPQILVERVTYSDRGSWPADAGGSGASLHRLVPTEYGNDPVNWIASAPSAGLAHSASTNPLVVVVQPQSRSAYIGETVTFTVMATGDAPVSYQWLSNGVPLSGQMDTNLTLTIDQTSQAANYSAKVTNPGGTVFSDVAKLTVASLPVGSAVRSGPGSLQVSFTVLSNRLYQIESRTNLVLGSWIPLGIPTYATGSTLTVEDLVTNQQRFYRLVVSP